MKAVKHKHEHARKLKGPDDVLTLIDRSHAMKTVSTLESSEHGRFFTPCVTECIKPALVREVETRVSKPIEVDPTAGM